MVNERQTETNRSRVVSGSTFCLVLVVYLGKFIALYDVVLDPKCFQVHGKVQVFPCVILSMLILREMLAFEPLPLGHPRILHHRLINADGVILQEIVDDHRTYAVVLLRAARDIFAEKCIEAQHLKGRRWSS